MKKGLISFLLLTGIYFLGSCNYKFVNKRYIVKDIKGYLVFNNNNDVVFFPYEDTVDMNFLSDNHKKKGFRVEFDTYWLDSISTDYSNLLYIENDNRFSIIPAEIRCYLGTGWQTEDEYSAISYKLNNRTFELPYRLHDWRYIIEIHLLRKSDKAREAKLNIDYGPPHYRQFRRDWPGLNY